MYEKDLKNKKVSLENHNILQLYSVFVKDILQNKKKYDEINKKLNDDSVFNNKKEDKDKFNNDNLDIILEKQDYVIFCKGSEKGECTILQCSNSVIRNLGYIKQDIISKNINILIPHIILKKHNNNIKKKLESYKLNNNSNLKSEKNQIFMLFKNKIGYLVPFYARFRFYNDDDFNNTYIIKMILEKNEKKSDYDYYILTKNNFIVDSFSSSSINLGLSIDIIKKYVVNLNVLIRDENGLEFDIYEKYEDYINESKKITWIYPDIIYPKDEDAKYKKEKIYELIKISNKKIFNLSIKIMKFSDEEEIEGFCLKISQINNYDNTLKNKQNVNLIKFDKNIENSQKKLIMYDILKSNFVRTKLIKEKEDLNQKYFNYTYDIEDEESEEIIKKKTLKTKKEEKEEENILTKEKVNYYKYRSSNEIKLFINNLKYYGNDITLEKHKPNKERYAVGK